MMKATVLAAAAAIASAKYETGTFSAEEFEHQGASADYEQVTFSASLPMRNFDILEKELMEISNPQSKKYGQWKTQEYINTLTAPDAKLRQGAHDYFAKHGAQCVNFPHSLRCTASVAAVNKMFKTTVSAFRQTTKNGKVVHRIHPNDDYEFPQELVGKVDFVNNLTEFPTVKRRYGRSRTFGSLTGSKLRGTNVGVDDTFAVTAEVLQNMYNSGSATGNQQSSYGPAEFQADASFNQQDLSVFQTQNSLPQWNVSNIVGTFSPSSPDLEASLDMQYIMSLTENAAANSLWYWTEQQWMYDFTQNLANTPNSGLPSVFSMSWGWWEGDQCTISQLGPCSTGNDAQSYAFVQATNQGFAAAAARGITFLVSSGDSGAHGRTDGTCTSTITRPAYPATSPYVTAVGASQLSGGSSLQNPKTPVCQTPPSGYTCASGATEIVCSPATGALISSGGGFSNVAARPSWQDKAVAAYATNPANLPGDGNWNKTGRGMPDVAALGHNYVVEYTGSPTFVDGTSCSAPVWGGVIGLTNAARLAAGKPVLGFANPAIYQIAQSTANSFHDITSGNNDCSEDGCTDPNGNQCTGFSAAPGWDATTGWGSPNVANFIQAALAL